MHHSEISHKQDTSLEFYEFQYQMILPHTLLTYLHLSTDGCHGTLMVSAVVVPSCVVFVFWAFLCCVTVHYQAGHLKNVLPLVQNDNYSEPKLVCRQLFSHVYEDIKSVYTFFQFLSQQISK